MALSIAAAQSPWDRLLPRKTPRAPQAWAENPETFKINSRSFCDNSLSCCQSVRFSSGMAAWGGSAEGSTSQV